MATSSIRLLLAPFMLSKLPKVHQKSKAHSWKREMIDCFITSPVEMYIKIPARQKMKIFWRSDSLTLSACTIGLRLFGAG